MAVKNSSVKRKSAARIEKDRKRKASARNRKLLTKIAMIVLAIALISLMVFAFVAPPRVVG